MKPALRLTLAGTATVLAGAFGAVSATGALGAQTARAGTTTTDRLLARADSITVGDYCRVATRTLGVRSVIVATGDDSTAARLSAASICDPLLADFSLRALRGDAPAPFSAIGRVHTGGYSAMRRTVFDAMDEFRSIVRATAPRDALRQSGDSSVAGALTVITETAHSLLVLAARDSALARLARYERKLGPTSAKLNLPETVLNYAAQRWVPGFAPRATTGPSPLELVASYVPTYATYADNKPQAVSASEFGVRWYLFGDQFGATGFRGLLFPSYWSAGALTVSDRNGALVWPWDGRTRTGAYLSWGTIKVGYVSGRRGSFILSRQTQIIPFVF